MSNDFYLYDHSQNDISIYNTYIHMLLHKHLKNDVCKLCVNLSINF